VTTQEKHLAVYTSLVNAVAGVEAGPGAAPGNFWVQGIFLEKSAWPARSALEIVEYS
jgi:hypothetical protein